MKSDRIATKSDGIATKYDNIRPPSDLAATPSDLAATKSASFGPTRPFAAVSTINFDDFAVDSHFQQA